MSIILSTRFRDLIKIKFCDFLFWHAPLDEQPGQQEARDLIASRQGNICENILSNMPHILPGLEGSSLSSEGAECLVRDIGEPGDFALITGEDDWQIHLFTLSNSRKAQVLIATESLGNSVLGDGFALSEQSDGALRFDFIQEAQEPLSAQTASGVSKPNSNSLIML
jgi:hypothetical protein